MGRRAALEQGPHSLSLGRRHPPPFAAARIYASTEGGLRYIARAMTQADPVLLRLVSEVVQAGDTVWDVGANVGLFSFAAAVAARPSGLGLAVRPDGGLRGRPARAAARTHR